MNIAIIPARIGSKRLLKKNIKLFLKKPIISYVIKEAKKSRLFDKILVSTDSKKIKKIAEFYGAEVPYLRPKNLSNDNIHFNHSIKHMIEWLEKNNTKVKNVCCIYPTSPLLDSYFLIEGLKILSKNKNFVFSACKFRSPPQRSFFFKNRKLTLFDKSSYLKRSQDLRDLYHDAGQFYWGSKESWLRIDKIFNKNSSIVEVPYLNFIDINYHQDWKIAEKLFQLKNNYVC
jgi:pseudaminic acid cytidylyltransferase